MYICSSGIAESCEMLSLCVCGYYVGCSGSWWLRGTVIHSGMIGRWFGLQFEWLDGIRFVLCFCLFVLFVAVVSHLAETRESAFFGWRRTLLLSKKESCSRTVTVTCFTNIGGSCHMYNFCCNKHTFVRTNTCLSRQNMSFVATNIILHSGQHVFVATKLLSQQKLYLWQLLPMINTHTEKTTLNYFRYPSP